MSIRFWRYMMLVGLTTVALFRLAAVPPAGQVIPPPAELRGVVIDEPIQRVNSQILTLVDDQGQTWRVITSLWPVYHGAVELVVTCRPPAPPSPDFPVRRPVVRDCLARQVNVVGPLATWHWRQPLTMIRRWTLERVTRLWPDPAGQIVAGLLLGIDDGIPPDLTTAIRRVGITHVLAVSGSHITLLIQVTVAILLAMGMHRRLALIVASGVMLLFVIMIGAPASAVRALIMGLVAVVAVLGGRRSSGEWALLVTVLGTLIVQPIALWDVGWQLSVAAVLGLVAWQEQLGGWLSHQSLMRHCPKIVVETTAMTIAAQVATWPIILKTFGQWSVIAPLANILIVPLVPFATIGAGVAVGLSTLMPVGGRILAFGVWLIIRWWLVIIDWLAAVPFAALDQMELSSIQTWLVGGVLILVAGSSIKQRQRGVYE
ncbi:MAG: ComEC/Rec2 family competence protein [Patescibacteria group bacterium]